MVKISKSSSIHKKRIHNDYVDRNTTVTNEGTIDRVDPVTPAENNTSYSSGNYLIASDEFYDKLQQLSEEYKKFYHDERELEKAIDNIKDNDDKLTEHMAELVEKYNKAIISLSHFDKNFDTDYISLVKEIISGFRNGLKKVGIEIINEKRLDMDEEIFRDKVLTSQNAITNLFRPIRLMIVRLYRVFKNIKVPKEKHTEKGYQEYEDYGDVSRNNYSGLILDEKS